MRRRIRHPLRGGDSELFQTRRFLERMGEVEICMAPQSPRGRRSLVPDPRWAQLAADKYLYRLALDRFHRLLTTGVLVSFFKIKQLEEHMISRRKGIRPGLPMRR